MPSMNYVQLYNLAQETISARIAAGKTSAIVPVVELKDALKANVAWLDDINFHPIDVKDDDPLGHFECYSDTDSRWDDPDAWTVLVTYASHFETNMCKKRFIWCKELMHIFDTEDGCVKTAEEYRGLLREIELKPIEPSTSYLTENTAKWLALMVLAPKEQRDALMAQAENDGLSEYDVALRLRIPEVIVKSLFSDYYDTYYQEFVENA